jgi:hypothetical protein
VSSTAEIGFARILVAASVRKDQRDTVLLTVEADVVPFRVATRVRETSFFVRLTAVASVAKRRDATSLRWEDRAFVQLTAVAAVAPLMAATSRLNRRQSFVSSTAEAKSVHTKAAKRLRVDVPNIVPLMVEEYAVNWKDATALPLDGSNFVELMVEAPERKVLDPRDLHRHFRKTVVATLALVWGILS